MAHPLQEKKFRFSSRRKYEEALTTLLELRGYEETDHERLEEEYELLMEEYLSFVDSSAA